MDIEPGLTKPRFELVPMKKTGNIRGTAISLKRLVIGRAEVCDLVINHPSISAVHAVLEVTNTGAKVFDLNSRNGTSISGKKSVVADIKPGMKVRFGSIEFLFDKYSTKDLLPPVLEMLTPPGVPMPIEESPVEEAPKLPKRPKTTEKTKKRKERKLPKSPVVANRSIPRISYPLGSDPNAEFCEYIFEDVETLYPIFKYDISGTAVEVVTVFRDQVFSVDYIPSKKGTYYLSGYQGNGDTIEYPYLAKKEKFPFIDLDDSDILVSKPLGFDVLFISDKTSNTKKPAGSFDGPFSLRTSDILRFSKDDLEIYVRHTDIPPEVKPAPFFRRDKKLKGYLAIVSIFMLCLMTAANLYVVDKEIEKEKIPERVATILYKKKKFIPKRSKAKTIPNTKQTKKIPPRPKAKVARTKSKQKVEKQKVVTPPKRDFKKIVKNPKAGSPPKGNKQLAKAKKAGAKSKSQSKRKSSKRARFSKTNKSSRGAVDTYKAINFKSTVSSLVAKGGRVSGVKGGASSYSASSLTTGGVSGGTAGAQGLKRAKVSKNIGSLTGSASGKLIGSTDAKGLVNKRAVVAASIPSETLVLGSMDPDIIAAILREHIPQFRYCYQKELDRSTGQIGGVVKLDFVIGASGHVSRAGVSGSRLPGPVRRCVSNVLRGIKFPEPLGGSPVGVKQPINFYPEG